MNENYKTENSASTFMKSRGEIKITKNNNNKNQLIMKTKTINRVK